MISSCNELPTKMIGHATALDFGTIENLNRELRNGHLHRVTSVPIVTAYKERAWAGIEFPSILKLCMTLRFFPQGCMACDSLT